MTARDIVTSLNLNCITLSDFFLIFKKQESFMTNSKNAVTWDKNLWKAKK